MPLTESELKDIEKIQRTSYMKPPLRLLNNFIKDSKKSYKQSIKEAFNHIHTFMIRSIKYVEKIQDDRLARGEIKDSKQASKAIAGNMFPNMVRFVFLKNKEAKNIPMDIFITNKGSAIKHFGEDFTIYVDDETQKPDCDLVIYNKTSKKMIILSLKTSLRERAGQTYKWKLLLEIANSSDTALKNKYGITYKGKNIPLICFATVNFYNEINNPQQKGMFKFFDKAFIAKPNIKAEFVSNLSELPKFIKETIA